MSNRVPMQTTLVTETEPAEYAGNGAAAVFPLPNPKLGASGLYAWTFRLPVIPQPIPILTPVPIPHPIPGSAPEPGFSPAFDPSGLLLGTRDEVRLDVDGRYPQMTISGTIIRGLSSRVHWIAKLTGVAKHQWSGSIWYKDGDVASFPYTDVQVMLTTGFLPGQNTVTVTYSGGSPGYSRVYKYESSYFHTVEFEYDAVAGVTAVTSINTQDHPNRPASLPAETLTLETVYRRAGFAASKSGGDTVIPSSAAGSDATWSDLEMHDAMQTYWSRFDNKAQWSLWVLFAALHDTGSSLGGVMFDDIGPNHRQGTAIFQDSFISNAPAGDPEPAAFVQRMRFWTAAHEMGHAFNLAHAWQKSHPPTWGTPWIPLANEPESRSFMNYPYNVAGGTTAFFANFEYRFTDQELLFLRHAPARFVQMGNAAWFDHHGFEQANVSPEPALKLELRLNRTGGRVEFLEPVMVEMKLTNVSDQPQLIPDKLLLERDHMTVIVKRDGQPARQFLPHAQHCWRSNMSVLLPGQSIYEAMFVSAGKNGWVIAEPGNYTVQIALHLEESEEDLVSNRLQVRVLPPGKANRYDEEVVAQDFFTDEVGRILRFDGSRYFKKGNDTLREVTERLPETRAAIHAQLALGNAISCPYKELVIPGGTGASSSAAGAGAEIALRPAQEDEARRLLHGALTEQAQPSAESLGHIWYKRYVDRFSDWLKDRGDTQAATEALDVLLGTLEQRGVLEVVLEEVRERRSKVGGQN